MIAAATAKAVLTTSGSRALDYGLSNELVRITCYSTQRCRAAYRWSACVQVPVRVQLPDGMVLQASFQPLDPLQKLKARR